MFQQPELAAMKDISYTLGVLSFQAFQFTWRSHEWTEADFNLKTNRAKQKGPASRSHAASMCKQQSSQSNLSWTHSPQPSQTDDAAPGDRAKGSLKGK